MSPSTARACLYHTLYTPELESIERKSGADVNYTFISPHIYPPYVASTEEPNAYIFHVKSVSSNFAGGMTIYWLIIDAVLQLSSKSI